MVNDHVSININEMFERLSPIQPECRICKVPDYLLKGDEKAYEPQRLAIGPYHHGKLHLTAMEDHKFRYLQKLLEERAETNVSKYVEAMRELEKRARKYYTDVENLKSEDFIKMMLLDGCFVVQLIRMYFNPSSRVDNDPIFKVTGLCYSLLRDLLLLENQIPFFVVLELLGMIGIPDKEDFTRKILKFLNEKLPDLRFFEDDVKSIGEIRHLLDLIHEYWRPPPREIEVHRHKGDMGFMSTRCATELKYAGIKFKNVEGNSLFDIKFEYGTLKIPTLKINDWTNNLLRNLIALEQLSPCGDINYVTDYALFMGCLINSAKDVKILGDSGIFYNCFGDEVVATMFNRLTDSGFYTPTKYYYREVSYQVKQFCGKPFYKWQAVLNRNYFYNRLAVISIYTILLTLIQTIFSGIALQK